MMNNVYNLLNDIRKCPALYLGHPSVSLLEAFIHGYLYDKKESDAESCHFMHCFSIYVKQMYIERYNLRTQHGWAQLIEFFNGKGMDAINGFYKILDKFVEEKGWETINPDIHALFDCNDDDE